MTIQRVIICSVKLIRQIQLQVVIDHFDNNSSSSALFFSSQYFGHDFFPLDFFRLGWNPNFEAFVLDLIGGVFR